jgi:hypothetical protein
MSSKSTETSVFDMKIDKKFDALVAYTLDSSSNNITFSFSNIKKEFKSEIDLWEAFKELMLWLEINELKLSLYGCRYDVHASGFLRSSSNGVLAYLLYDGKPTSVDDIVNVFDESNDNIGTLKNKLDYYNSWKETLRKNSK